VLKEYEEKVETKADYRIVGQGIGEMLLSVTDNFNGKQRLLTA